MVAEGGVREEMSLSLEFDNFPPIHTPDDTLHFLCAKINAITPKFFK